MSFFNSPITEPRQRHLIIKAAADESSVEEIAATNGFELEELRRWVQLYQTHGEGILSPEQRPKAELELFKLKYPGGKPQLGFEQVLEQTFSRSKHLIFVLVVLIPSLTGLGFALMSVLGPRSLQESLVFGSTCGFSTMVLFALIAIVWMMLRTSRQLVTGKIDEVVYVSEHRKVVSEQELTGALQIAVDSDGLQGGLALAQDAGGLEVVAQDDSAHVVFDHTTRQEEVDDVKVDADKQAQT